MKFSRFSKQLDPGSGILRLMADLGEAVSGSREVLMLGGGNPARIDEMEQIFRDQMQQLMARGREFEEMLGNYDAPQGNQLFCEALAPLLSSQLGHHVSADNIAITNGSQSGFGILFNLFSGIYEDGSVKKILLPMTPEYIGYNDVGFGEGSIFTAAKPSIELLDEQMFKYHVDFKNIDCDENIGAICVSRPTNPTGNVITDDELAGLRALARQHDIPLIIDGAYGLPFPGIIFSDAKPVWDENIILCLSLSKLGLPGVRTGIIVADTGLIELITGASAIFTLSPGRFGPTLMRELTASGELLRLSENVVRPFYKNRSAEAIEQVRQAMHDLPVRIHVSEGAIFLWLWFDGLPITSEQLYQRLKRRGVMVIAGEHFFPGLEEPDWDHTRECLRVSYAGAKDEVQAGIDIIAEEARSAYRESGALPAATV